MHRLPLIAAVVLLLMPMMHTHVFAQGTTGEAAGITFETLSAADLDVIQQNSGYRLGVQVQAVKAGSPGAAAGLKPTDVIFAIGKTGVDSAEKAVAAVKAASGAVDLPGMTLVDGTFQVKVFKLSLAAQIGNAANGKPTGDAPKDDERLVNKQATDPVEAYFDMMDFIRTQAWSRPVSTSEAERQRVALQLQQTQLDQKSATVLLQIPQAWAAVQQQWKKWADAQKSKQRAEWRDQLLVPGGLYPAPADVQTYRAPQNLVSFQYPGTWTGGMTEANGTPLLFVGPGGAQMQWEQVVDTPNSPDGALFALAQVTNDMKGMSYMQAAHYLARLLIPTGLEKLKVVQELPIGDIGAVITLSGKFPGQSDEKFFWIGVVKFGDSQIFAGRMGGSVKNAEALIPAFTYMLQTLQLNPPQAAAGGGVSGAWDAAWSRVDVAITKNIWAPSGN